jgi:UDP-N-acetylmuramoyl-L-alanyl-D-glutamate--2,6-diaminopimelate ligase
MTDAGVAKVMSWLRDHVPLSTAMTSDSRKVERGDIFIAYPGRVSDGRRFIPAAIERGAAAILYDSRDDFAYAGQVPAMPVADLKHQAGHIASDWYGVPSAQMFSIAVTGTSGKSTSALWLAQALAALGHKPVLIGTLGAGFLGELTDTGHTTPDPVDVERLLARLHARGADVLAMEVTSVGLVEGRANGLAFDVALFTNLSHDHLDYHGSMESYRRAKAMLFSWPGLRAGVVNADDPAGADMLAALSEGVTRLTFSASGNPDTDLFARDIVARNTGMDITLDGRFGKRSFSCSVLGRYNADNLLGVLCVLLAAGVEMDLALEALASITPAPGRLEPVVGHEGDASVLEPLVLVDYAHKPDALEKVLLALRPTANTRGGKLIALFGCGGDRDRAKRPVMGEIASRLADRVVVTSDNPRSESPDAIVDEIVAGVTRAPEAGLIRITDRRMAICRTIGDADVSDVVLIAGKGHETYQEIAGVKSEFSDLLVAREALLARSAVAPC